MPGVTLVFDIGLFLLPSDPLILKFFNKTIYEFVFDPLALFKDTPEHLVHMIVVDLEFVKVSENCPVDKMSHDTHKFGNIISLQESECKLQLTLRKL